MNSKEIRIGSLLLLDTAFFLLEAIVGYSVHSLALVADSFHMLNDIVSLIIAFWAVRIKNSKPADGRYTYGWQRAEILGALINAVFLLALCFTIILDSIQRFFEPQEIQSPKLVLIVGVAGLLSNCIGLVLFNDHGHSHGHGHSHSSAVDTEANEYNSDGDFESFMPDRVVDRIDERSALLTSGNSTDKKSTEEDEEHSHEHSHTQKKRSMNMEGVFLHVLGDALGNVGVIISGLFIWKTDYSWRFYSDPIVSLTITAIIFSSALPLCRKSSKILLQAAPPNVDSTAVINAIKRLPSVKSVHDFHVWNLNEDILIASMHLELDNLPEVNKSNAETLSVFNSTVAVVREVLHKFGIHSATIQPEFSRASQVLESNSTLSAYAQTNGSNCVIDDAAKCDSAQCLK